MKDSQIFVGCVMLFLASFFMASCLNEDNKIPPNCYDGILNNGEEFIDCGGPNCPLCDPCENFTWDPELGEQWVDCGGECEPCDPSFNGQLDPGEEGIDCGGDTGVDCGELCGDGLLNGLEEDIDCGGPDCDPCPSCTDMEMNGDEIGIDCGGEDCPDCATDGDCTNGLLDGDELYIDCGGTTCPDCEGVFTWKANGTQYESEFSTTATIAGTTITIGGVTLSGASMGFTIPEPETVGWIAGAQVTFDPSTAPTAVGAYQDPGGVQFVTSAPVGSIVMDIVYVDAVSGGIIVGTFSGNTQTVDESQTASIQNGYFLLPID